MKCISLVESFHTTFSSSASFFSRGTRGHDAVRQSPRGGQGLPCRLPRCLFPAYINRRLHTFVAVVVVVWRSRRCCNEYRASRTVAQSPHACCASTRAFLAGLRKTRHYPCEIETPPRFPPRVVVRKRRHWEGAWEGRRACFGRMG